MNNYKSAKLLAKDQAIQKIQEYITKNNLTYTANNPDFIKGLILGLDVGLQTMFFNLTGFNPIPEENAQVPNNIKEYLNVTDINDTPTPPNIDTNI